jgi:hypothetical protein
VLSQRFVFAVRTSRHRGYELARFAGISASTLSSWLTNARRVRDNDPRVLKIGAALGLSAAECFEDDPDHYELPDRCAPLEAR